ncbi:MAG: DeoR/GlpR transcriptional regulator [Clostridia bacterium]|nr:DeoR/GlpR transcriptional regulator [Clostridia bacterium]
MADNKLKIDIRRGRITELLKRNGKVSVSELSKALGVTPVTIRTDLDALESDGLLERINGGAIFADKDACASAEKRIYRESESEKCEIARTIATMISDGDTLFINSGTTTELIAKELKKLSNLNIVTNSLAVANALCGADSFRVILLGGDLNVKYGFTYAQDAQDKLRHCHADWAILSVDGISARSGITTYHAEETPIDSMMINGAARVLIAADHSKIGRTGFMHICDANNAITLVTDKGAPINELNELKAMGVTVIF